MPSNDESVSAQFVLRIDRILGGRKDGKMPKYSMLHSLSLTFTFLAFRNKSDHAILLGLNKPQL